MMHLSYVYCDGNWQKGMSWDEAMSNSEENKLVALCIVELCLAGRSVS